VVKVTKNVLLAKLALYLCMHKWFIIFFMGFLLACNAGKKKPKQKEQILALKNMSDLATVEYTISKVVKANDNKTWFKIGDRKILLTCQATVKAGIDMKAINENDITIKDNEISLTLPNAKIISFNMPAENIKVVYEASGLFRQDFNAAEKEELLVQGESQIQQQIETLGILKEAEKNATLFFENFLKQAGYEKVTINFGKLMLCSTHKCNRFYSPSGRSEA
jgi:hypothetical protein